MEYKFVERFKHLRKESGVYQKDVANAIGVSQVAICLWETNQRTPDAISVKKIAEYFEVSADYLLGLTEIPEPEWITAHAQDPTIAEKKILK